VSEDIVIGGGTEKILGSLDEANKYVGMMLGERYATWAGKDDTTKKKSLVNAVRFMNAWPWGSSTDTFDKRDAITAFKNAEYELAVLIVEDTEITDDKNQGSNISELAAGSAGVKFFNPTLSGADPFPPVLMRLIGKYLAAATASGPQGGSGQSGSCVNPFSSCSDDSRRKPW
jgi:hypothetical protein